MRTLGIDIETYSSNEIRWGVYKYVDAPDFEILLFGYAFDDEPVKCIDLTTQKLPKEIIDALYAPTVTKTAFNANFEITCLRKFFPDLPSEQWECTSVLALYNSLPCSLSGVAHALGLPEQKDTKGKALIRYFSMPCKPTKANGGRTRNLPSDAPEKWELYKSYNRQDVVVERAIREKLLRFKPTPLEHRYWLVDQRINRNGAEIDKTLVNNAIEIEREYKAHLVRRARELTGLSNPNSVSQLKGWVESAAGLSLESLDKKTVAGLLTKDLPHDVEEVLKIRQRLGKTSVKKFQAMQSACTSKGRIHGMFQFYGAMRTGRWAGRIVQLHNLPRNSMPEEDLLLAREFVKAGDLNALEMIFDNVSDALSQLVRTALVAGRGKRFIVADYSAIEARVIAWLAKEKWRQEVFAKNGDIYCASASQMFGVPVVKHGINGHLRQKGKVAELALGYGGSVGALKAMGADKMGLTDKEMAEIVAKWRAKSPRIVAFWRDVDTAAKLAVKTGYPQRIRQGNIVFHVDHGALFVELPSGRHLVYMKPKIDENRFGSESITYMGVMTAGWERLETYGGKLVENIVQAVARDCLADAMRRLTEAGYKICLHVHDEVIIEAPEGFGSLKEVIQIMTMNTSWNRGLITNADGFESPFYKKD